MSLSSRSQVLLESEQIGTFGTFDITLILSQIGSPPEFNIDYDVELYKLVYNTMDPLGNATIASGAIAVPIGYDCSFPIANYNHGTIVRRTDVPSNSSTEALIGVGMASSGYIVSLPDYLGLGDSPGRHPYVHADSQASATIDMIAACKEFLDGEGFFYNDQLFLFGYSQGGHACMATHKAIEEDPNSDLTVTASAPMSGPYDISGIQTQYLIDDIPYDSPGYLPYVVLAYQEIYDFLPQDLSDIFAPPYDTLLLDLFDGTQTFGEINAVLPAIPNEMIREDVFEAFVNDQDHPLRVALRDNDVFDWSPTAPIHMFYCTEDEQVDFENALLALEVLTENGGDIQVTNGGALTHGGCVAPALIGGKAFFDSFRQEGLTQDVSFEYDFNIGTITIDTDDPSIFEYAWSLDGVSIDFTGSDLEASEFGFGVYEVLVSDVASGCSENFTVEALLISGLNELDAIGGRLYPNPSSGSITLEVGLDQIGEPLSIFSGQGTKVYETRITSAVQQLDTESLSAGVYILRIGNGIQEKLVKY